MSLKFVEVTTDSQIKQLAHLAHEIWFGYWPGLIGREQTAYMVEKFQSEPAIRRDLAENDYTYWFLYDVDDTETDGEAAGETPLSDSQIVGFTGGHPDIDTNRFFISKIYLLPEARGRGFCSRVIEHYVALCKNRGFDAMYLTVNKGNELGLRAYRGNGFYVADEVVLDIGDGFVMDDYIMQKDVTPAETAA
jgi:ribosomal protein S18 acetylase RimI-like enzyme